MMQVRHRRLLILSLLFWDCCDQHPGCQKSYHSLCSFARDRSCFQPRLNAKKLFFQQLEQALLAVCPVSTLHDVFSTYINVDAMLLSEHTWCTSVHCGLLPAMLFGVLHFCRRYAKVLAALESLWCHSWVFWSSIRLSSCWRHIPPDTQPREC